MYRHPRSCLRQLHLVMGLVTLAAFVLTGQYLDKVHDHLVGMPDGPRLFLRSAHIYLLWSGIANALLGCHLARAPRGFARPLQTSSSLLILAAPLLLAYSFFLEPYGPDLQRPVSWWANVAAFAGVLGHAAAHWLGGRGNADAAMTPAAER
ncbi:hypothetical protein [Arenimonas sp. MALMAid1274]|uniref:hypothetical protein n=1 Tax=Arenimonas sp. MALMAid1274 TaxID=3411630 RepID=UPI003B9F3432